MTPRKSTLAALLAGQGFGSRNECAALIRAGEAKVGHLDGREIVWRRPENPDEPTMTAGLHLRIGGLTVPYLEQMHLVFHKPADTECSHTPTHHPSVFSLLPAPFLRRGLEAVGRLDADTTGMLLFSDSGLFNRFLTFPKRHVPKTYRVGLKHPVTEEQKLLLEAGVKLHGEEGLTLPAKVTLTSEKSCDVLLEEGKYHQVKRMFGAVGNRVESIHRIAIGNLRLEETLLPGQWRILTESDLLLLGYSGK